MRFYIQFLLVFALLAAVGCAKQKYTQCEAPNDNLKIMFKAKNPAHPFSHSFCIVCNPGISPDEHTAWALEMGTPKAPGDPEEMHPCLYVYPPENQEWEGDNDSMEQCKAWVCSGEATYSDMVSPKNGNIDLNDLVNGEIMSSEQWHHVSERAQNSVMEPVCGAADPGSLNPAPGMHITQ